MMWSVPLRLFVASQFMALMADRAMSLIYVSLAEQRATFGASAGSSANLLVAAQVLPLLVFSPFGGIIADRFEKKWVMWWADLGRLLVVLTFLVANGTFSLGLNSLVMTVFVLGLLTAVFNPAKKSLLPALVRRDQIDSASAAVSASEVLAMLTGLGVGTALLKLLPATSALVVSCFGVVIAIALLTLLKSPKTNASQLHTAPLSYGLATAFGYVSRSRQLKTAIFAVNMPFYLAAAFFFAGANSFAATRNPENAGAELGPLMLSLCAGAILSIFSQRILGVSRLSLRTQVVLPFIGGSVTVAGCAALLTFHDSISIRLVTFGMVGAFVGLIYVRTVALLQRISPVDLLGRTIGINEVISALSFVVVMGGVGLLGKAPAALHLMIFSACVLFIGGCAAGFGFRENDTFTVA